MRRAALGTPNKQQLRTTETRARLLDAAEQVFVREGYESAQLDEIASIAGRSKGAVYTHFKSKEDLFLALYEHRTRTYIGRLIGLLQKCTSRKKRMETFREFYLGIADDKVWPILTLEFRLFALRRPKLRERFRNVIQMSWTADGGATGELLFGKLTRSARAEIDQSLLALGPVMSGLILESHFEPKVLTEKAVRRVLGRIFDALTEARG
jgi:AcrR family transcriptional regulator